MDPRPIPPRQLAKINLPPSPLGTYQAFAGLARPLSPDARYFAYYDAQQDRIVLLSLTDIPNTLLPAAARAGCWFGPEHFIAASDREMRLFTLPHSPSTLLARAPCLPRSASFNTRQLIFCARAADPYALSLERATILLAQ